MRLNKWQCAGIVLSIGWAVGAAIYQRNTDVGRAHNSANWNYKLCARDSSVVLGLPPANPSELANCERERETNLAVQLEGSWVDVALMALVPIPFGWFAAYVVLGIGRGAAIGFRAVVPWATMTRRRKVFVVGGLASLAVVALGTALQLMDLYVATKVPVALYPFSDFSQGSDWAAQNDEWVRVTGTWTRTGIEGGIIDPLQTSQIDCYRTEHRCSEAKASVSVGSVNLLKAELIEYEIESWSPTTIVFKQDDSTTCTAETFTIDRLTKSVNGIGRVTTNATDNVNCKYAKEEGWNYHLVDGFTVYWAEREKARPYPLRLFQALFGN